MSIQNYTSDEPCYFYLYKKNTITLIYPNSVEESIYLDRYGVNEIINTISQILKYCLVMPDMMRLEWFKEEHYIKHQLEIARVLRDYDLFVAGVEKFNIQMKWAIEYHMVLGHCTLELPFILKVRMDQQQYQLSYNNVHSTHPQLIEHIYDQSYNRIVSEKADGLRRYKAFSSEVYGEINFSFMKDILKNIPINKDSLFVDLGCGIGNALCQVAGLTQCHCVGIEIMDNVADLALELKTEFMKRMTMFNQYCGHIQVIKGDFTNNELIKSVLKGATVVFVNNFVYTPELNVQLEQLLWNLQDDCYIISLVSFVRLRKGTRHIPLSERLHRRSIDHIESILHVEGTFK